MMTTAARLVAAARADIENLTNDELDAELARGDVVLVDLREPSETAGGTIPGALCAPRGMLEFHADPTSPYHLEPLDPTRRTILYCASGGRSALAVRTLQTMGYTDVAHLADGYGAWAAERRPVTAGA